MGADEAVGNEPIDWFDHSLQAQALQQKKIADHKDNPQREIQTPASRPAPVSPHVSPAREPKRTPSAAEPVIASQEMIADARKAAEACKSIDDLISALESFQVCPLARTASNLCFIDGNRNAKILIIGEAPEREEDLQGKPFVGRSGKLLDKMISHIGLSRDDQNDDRSVLLANCVFWRPPGNRKPTQSEISMCMPFVNKLIELVKPQIIVCLGSIPSQRLTGETKSIVRLRGRWFDWIGRVPGEDEKIPILATLPPARLLLQPKQKKLFWNDIIDLKKRSQAIK